MIELTPTAALMLYLSLTLLALLGLWIYQQVHSRKRKIYFPEKELFICEYCNYAYLDDSVKKVIQCPQCKSYNNSGN